MRGGVQEWKGSERGSEKLAEGRLLTIQRF